MCLSKCEFGLESVPSLSHLDKIANQMKRFARANDWELRLAPKCKTRNRYVYALLNRRLISSASVSIL